MKKAIEYLRNTHIIWKTTSEKDLIVEAIKLAYEEGKAEVLLPKDQNDAVSDTTKAEQSSTSLPQNPDNWREETAKILNKYGRYANSIKVPPNWSFEAIQTVMNEYATQRIKAHDEEIERLREELAAVKGGSNNY